MSEVILLIMPSSKFTICARKRPCHGEKDVISTTENTISVTVDKVKVDLKKYKETKTFEFDKVYSERDDTCLIYDNHIQQQIENNNNLICYTFGETGSGKTHTLLGPGSIIESAIFDLVNNYDTVMISSYEIYRDQLYDMLNRRQKLTMLENYNDIHIPKLHWKKCNYKNMQNIFETIKQNRKVGTSSENDQSSRSHCLVHIKANNKNYIFVDLAGSEKGKKSVYENKQQHYEMASINSDIFNLKECIRKKNTSRIPFRSCKLTIALRDVFYNNYSAVMIVTISPEKSNISESVNILNCASNMKHIKRKPKISKSELPNIISNPGKVIIKKKIKNIEKFADQTYPLSPVKSKVAEAYAFKMPILKNSKYEPSVHVDILQRLIKKESNICNNYINNGDSNMFGEKMAANITDQVNVIRKIDQTFGKKFFALS